jgi:hypothetical protein
MFGRIVIMWLYNNTGYSVLLVGLFHSSFDATTAAFGRTFVVPGGAGNAFMAGMFVLSMTFKRDARWRSFWPYSLALAFAALITFFLKGDGQWTGLYQRIFNGTILLWLILAAIRLRSIASRSVEGKGITDETGKSTLSN